MTPPADGGRAPCRTLHGDRVVDGGPAAAACGALPAMPDRPTSSALAPAADSVLGRAVRGRSAEPEHDRIPAYACGLLVARRKGRAGAPRGPLLDVQYYLIERSDRASVHAYLRDAALRGVRVRLLVDDLNTAGGDQMFRGLAAFENVEVRISIRSAAAGKRRHQVHGIAPRLSATEPPDAQQALYRRRRGGGDGGRNIADQYSTRSPTSNFVDMDVLLVGGAMQRLRDIFDMYWNSQKPIPSKVSSPAATIEAACSATLIILSRKATR